MSVFAPIFRSLAITPGWLRNELWRRAKAVPSLDLRFADNKSLVDAITDASLVTFTRASSATYVDSQGVIQTAVTNDPRFDHNHTTGESLGLLVEEARTNLLVRSEEFDNASWAKANVFAFGSGSTANAITAPDNNTTADLLVENTSVGNHQAQQSASVVSGTVYSVSIFVKAPPSARRLVSLVASTNFTVSPTAMFDISTGSVVSANNGTASIIALPNGWYRCTLTTVAATSSGSNTFNFRFDNGTSTSYTGDGTSGLYLWGAQLEAGAFPTSYIPTTTATATRSADVASITGSAFTGWYRQGVGTLSAQYIAPPAIQNANTCSISDGTTNNRVTIRAINSSNQTSFFVVNGNVTQVGQVMTGPLNGVVNTSVIAFANDDVAMTKNTLGIFTDTSATIPTNLDQFKIGADGNGSSFHHNNTISRLTYWPQRLPNSSLQAITQ